MSAKSVERFDPVYARLYRLSYEAIKQERGGDDRVVRPRQERHKAMRAAHDLAPLISPYLYGLEG